MPMTKEERVEYMKQYMIDNSEKRKEYRQTPQSKKTTRIAGWKRQGMKHDDFDYVHDHSNGEIRNVLCNSCNVNDRTDNTSGIPNIYKRNNTFIYKKIKNKINHIKYFKTKEEAIKYKEEYESTNR